MQSNISSHHDTDDEMSDNVSIWSVFKNFERLHGQKCRFIYSVL